MSECFNREKWVRVNFRRLLITLLMTFNFAFGQEDLENLSFGSAPKVQELAWPKINFDDFKIKHNQIKDNSSLIKLIQEKNPDGAIIQFSSKSYHFKNTVSLESNVIIKGVPEQTVFEFSLDKTAHLIAVNGGYLARGIEAEIVQKNRVQFNLSDKTKTKVDIHSCWIYIQPDDRELIYSDWAKGCSGQLLQGHYQDGVFHSSHPIIERLLTSSITVQLLNMKQNVGIEDIRIVNNSPAESPRERFSNILLQLAHNCWINNVESEKCNYAHIQIDKSTHCTIRQLKAHNAYNHGSGGVGYGVVLHYAASENLIDSCHFDFLRHAMLLQLGAKFNKLNHNTSLNPHWTGNFYRKNRASDIAFHGNYPESNLISNNLVNTIAFDRSHGLNGPNNVIINNKTIAYGIIMSRKSVEDGQIIKSNTICKKGKLKVKGNHQLSGNERIKCTN